MTSTSRPLAASPPIFAVRVGRAIDQLHVLVVHAADLVGGGGEVGERSVIDRLVVGHCPRLLTGCRSGIALAGLDQFVACSLGDLLPSMTMSWV